MAIPTLNHLPATALTVMSGQEITINVEACPQVLPPPFPAVNRITITLRLPAFPAAYFIEGGVHVDHIDRIFGSTADFSMATYSLTKVKIGAPITSVTTLEATATNRQPLISMTRNRTVNIN
jgi:hypothetical protein